MLTQVLAVLSISALPLASAFDRGVYGLGVWNETYAIDANANPNVTKSVPFQIGNQNYTFEINVSEFVPTSATANRTNDPHQAAAFYNLIWSGNYSLNDTFRNAWSYSQEVTPRVCVSVSLGPQSIKSTNAYKEKDNGDCSNALGDQCMKDLRNTKSTQILSSCSAQWMPKSCVDRLGYGGFGSTGLTVASNATNDAVFQRSPREFAWYQSEIYSGANTSYLEREVDRLHVVFFSGGYGEIYPVCLRVNDKRLNQDDNAVENGAVLGLQASVYLWATMALSIAASIL